MAMNHLTTFVSEKLDIDAMNYSSWVYYFSHLCHGYGILDHLVDPVTSSSTATPRNEIDFIISNDDVVTFALEGLPSTYETISTVIVSREPFPDLKTVRSLLTIHEMRLKSRVQNPLVDATSTSPMVLLAKSNTSARHGPFLEKVNNPCWSFAKGSCRFGDACKYLHNAVHGKSNLLPRTSGSALSVPDVTRSDLDILKSMLAKFGLNAPNTSTPSPPFAYTISVPPGFLRVSTQLSTQPTYTLFSPPQGVHLVHGPSQPPVQFTTGVQQQQGGSFPGSVPLGQSPSMPFHPSQLFASDSQVGDGRFIPVTNSGHSVLSTPFRPLRLNNVLITPNIVKNLIFFCQFVHDNSYTVEFDPFGFFMKDFITRRVLLRCDSTGDLYPVTKPSTIPHAFLTSQYTWHQQLGHPGSEVLCRLISSYSISCNKEKLPVLCHACQLGKHVKLPFFKCEIKSFQCDHGGDFDNHAFHKLFHDNVYLLNILPSRAINNEIPFTRMFGAQPDYSVLRVFGCLCYPHIDTNHKLGPCATPSIFLGHAVNHFGYHCLDLNTNKIIISRHVTFDEMVFPFPSTKSTTITYDVLDDSTDLISTIICTSPITPVPTPVHTPQVDVPTPHTPPTPPLPPTPQTTRPNPRYAGHVSTISPLHQSYKEAFNDPNWRNAKNKTWTSVPRPKGANIVRCMWLFRHKFFADGTLNRYKARLVSNGSTQVEGVDVDQTFCLVVKPGTIRTVLSLAISRHWHVHQLDVKNAFLHGDLAETIYMHQPPGFWDPEHPNYDCLLSPVDTESKLGDGGTPVCLYIHDPREPHFSALKRILRVEAEYRDIANVVAETCWIRNLLCELHTPLSSATIVYCDNLSPVYLSSNPVQHQRTKHIEIDIHFVRNLVAPGQVRVLHVPSRFQYADIFTKGLPSALFDEFGDSLSVCCTPTPTAREY
nr:ribonuclease H-like domain-containing protein [Tanacetum cinerariifolium]